jgi:hypothetical protein
VPKKKQQKTQNNCFCHDPLFSDVFQSVSSPAPNPHSHHCLRHSIAQPSRSAPSHTTIMSVTVGHTSGTTSTHHSVHMSASGVKKNSGATSTGTNDTDACCDKKGGCQNNGKAKACQKRRRPRSKIAQWVPIVLISLSIVINYTLCVRTLVPWMLTATAYGDYFVWALNAGAFMCIYSYYVVLTTSPGYVEKGWVGVCAFLLDIRALRAPLLCARCRCPSPVVTPPRRSLLFSSILSVGGWWGFLAVGEGFLLAKILFFLLFFTGVWVCFPPFSRHHRLDRSCPIHW